MRLIALFLILVNLGFFAWQYHKMQQPPVVVKDRSVSKVDALVLLSELPKQTSPASQQVMPLQNPCFSVGPFVSFEDVNNAAIEIDGVKVRTSTHMEQKIEHNYWVYLSHQESIKDARTTLSNLKKSGIMDVSIVLNEQRYVVSVGIFSQKDTSKQRYNKLLGLGYKPVLEERSVTSMQYWLDINEAEKGALSALFRDNLSDEFPGMQINQPDCK